MIELSSGSLMYTAAPVESAPMPLGKPGMLAFTIMLRSLPRATLNPVGVVETMKFSAPAPARIPADIMSGFGRLAARDEL